MQFIRSKYLIRKSTTDLWVCIYIFRNGLNLLGKWTGHGSLFTMLRLQNIYKQLYIEYHLSRCNIQQWPVLSSFINEPSGLTFNPYWPSSKRMNDMLKIINTFLRIDFLQGSGYKMPCHNFSGFIQYFRKDGCILCVEIYMKRHRKIYNYKHSITQHIKFV